MKHQRLRTQSCKELSEGEGEARDEAGETCQGEMVKELLCHAEEFGLYM